MIRKMAADRNSNNSDEKTNCHSNSQMKVQGDVNIDSIVEECSKEYLDLHKTMDQIDAWMTNIENQSDSLNSKIDELLKSNREIRMELQQQRKEENNSGQAEKQ